MYVRTYIHTYTYVVFVVTDERIAMEINLDMLKFNHYGYTGLYIIYVIEYDTA